MLERKVIKEDNINKMIIVAFNVNFPDFEFIPIIL